MVVRAIARSRTSPVDTVAVGAYHVNVVDIKERRDENLREAIELFYFAYRAFTAGPDQILGQRRLGRVHHRILYFVGRRPGIAVQELLQILDVSKQALNGPLRRLLDDALVAVRADPDDRRFKRLTLTHEGRKLEAHLTGTQTTLLASVFKKYGAKGEPAWKAIMRALPVLAGRS
jgi:DNA-binding MarR family transcriptional regulator